MLSEKSRVKIESNFRELAGDLPGLYQEIAGNLSSCSDNTALAMKYLYTTMPLSDMGNYSFETFLDFAEHGARLWDTGAYRDLIPEAVFLNYVLYHRINEEEILPCRSFFYEKLKKWVKGLSMKAAVLEVNYWCGEEAAYRSTDARCAAPMTVYQCGYGRCGEESTFAVSALRSIGIPARQVYAPRWSHCDDNHAWVEVWCDGSWYFFGACEPEEILNKGWFTNASSRAMLIHSRWFGFTAQEEEVIGREGRATLLNQLERYAPVRTVRVKVSDGSGRPVKDARAEFQIVNYSELTSLAVLLTDENGVAVLKLGLGNILIHVSKDDMYTELLIDTANCTECDLVLKEGGIAENCWQAFDMIAPIDSPVNTDMPTALQKTAGEVKFARAAAKRLEKVSDLRNQEIDKFLNSGSGNRELKEKLLGILTDKDRSDCKAEVLEEHFRYALPFKAVYEEGIFINHVLNPRIQDEPMYPYRASIQNKFYQEEKETFLNDPRLIWNWIDKNIGSRDEKEHPNVVTTPLGCLKLGIGSALSRQLLFVAIARTLGIPARLHPQDGTMEYWEKGRFIPVSDARAKSACLLLLSENEKVTWTYYQNFTVARYEKGRFTTLKPEGKELINGRLSLALEPGRYRIITSNRLPNGNIFANQYLLTLKPGEEEKVILFLREARLSDMLENISINDFYVKNKGLEKVSGSAITKSGKRILFWLEETKEPTEHILNELLERKKDFEKFSDQLAFIVRNENSLKDNTISKVLAAFPGAEVFYDDSTENTRTLGRRLYVDPDKLPLILVTSKELNGIYATSGYNVGTGDMLLRLMKEDLQIIE